MKKVALVFGVLLLFNGCNFNEEDDKEVTTSSKLISTLPVDEVRKLTIDDYDDFNITLTTDEQAYIKILEELDGSDFEIKDNSLVFKSPLIDYKKSYLVKIYITTSDGEERVILYEIILEPSTTLPTENNETNSTTSATTSEEVVEIQTQTPKVELDIDKDYIPTDIEELINKDPTIKDENRNGIVDGLEGDSFFRKQWYIKSTSEPMNPSQIPPIEGNDLNLLEVYSNYMGYNKGNPVIIQIVDSGVDSKHEDLKDNFDLKRSLNGATQGDPIPGGLFRPHGTMLAGIAAARAFNNVGVRGVAPFAKIAASNWLAKQSLDGLEKAWLSGEGANEIVVSNNSWGRYFTTDTIYEDIMAQGVKKLRDGKGRVYVFASGNAKADNADANIQYIINNRYALVVGALDYDNKAAIYSTPGANLWISAYGGSKSVNEGPTIATTYISGESLQTWDEDINRNYTYAMAGSSAAAPMVSGIIALIVEACPNLSYRDIKYIIAKSAKKVDLQNSSWVTNSAKISFSREYGFGLVDTPAAIEMCKNSYSLLPQEESVEVFKDNLNTLFTSLYENSLSIDKNLKIEWVELTIDLDTPNASEFDIYLQSPAGTQHQLLKSGTKVGTFFIPVANWMSGGFRFGAAGFLDEESIGDWKVEIRNQGENRAQIKSIKLKIYGHKER